MTNNPLTVTPFQFEDEPTSFDALGKENGFRYWSARHLQQLLGYSTWESFRRVINRVSGALTTLDIAVTENVVQSSTSMDGKDVQDFKLSKFACYLAAMNADSKIPQVAQAQAYFAAIAEAVQQYIQSQEDVERIDIRSEVTDRERSLGSVAKAHGVECYPFFHDAGYRGMYNMSLKQLKKHKGMANAKRPLLDFMGKRELAANLFRIQETEARIKHRNLRGQAPLETAARDVGSEGRKLMMQQGDRPEDLPLSQDIKKIGSDLKRTNKLLGKPAKKVKPKPKKK